MSKAQEVRKHRLEKMQADITAQAKKCFDWMLDLIDADTQKGNCDSFEVVLFDDESTLKTIDLSGKKDTEYFLNPSILQPSRLDFFKTLKEVIEKEEGYTADLNPTAILWEEKCITLTVNIK